MAVGARGSCCPSSATRASKHPRSPSRRRSRRRSGRSTSPGFTSLLFRWVGAAGSRVDEAKPIRRVADLGGRRSDMLVTHGSHDVRHVATGAATRLDLPLGGCHEMTRALCFRLSPRRRAGLSTSLTLLRGRQVVGHRSAPGSARPRRHWSWSAGARPPGGFVPASLCGGCGESPHRYPRCAVPSRAALSAN